MSDTYFMVEREAQAAIKVKGSRFMADALGVVSVDEAEARIAAIRKREYNATHHCTAFRVGVGGDVFRYNDDGEPSGTAGAPILRQIDAYNLTQTLVVVTRYYGGTKLGTGGLVRAYGEAAAEALRQARVVEHIIRVPLRLRFRYGDTSPAMHLIKQFDASIQETYYGEETEIIVGVRRSQVQPFTERFVDALGGRGEVERLR